MGTAPSPWDVSAPHPHPGTKGGTRGREDRSGAGGCSLPSSPNDAAAGWAGGVPSPHSPFGVRGTAAPFMYSSIYICTRDGDDGPSPGPPPQPRAFLTSLNEAGGPGGVFGIPPPPLGKGQLCPVAQFGVQPCSPVGVGWRRSVLSRSQRRDGVRGEGPPLHPHPPPHRQEPPVVASLMAYTRLGDAAGLQVGGGGEGRRGA